MPIEYGVMMMIVVLFLAGGLYTYILKRQYEIAPKDKPKTQFENEALEQIHRVKETGESVIVSERGRPIVEIRPAKTE